MTPKPDTWSYLSIMSRNNVSAEATPALDFPKKSKALKRPDKKPTDSRLES